MSLPRKTKRAIACGLVIQSACVFAATASPEDVQVADFLQSHDMLRLLQVQLEDRIDHADDVQRDMLVNELSMLYLKQLRETPPEDPYYKLLQVQAQALIKRMGSTQMYELRIELLIEQYLAVEPQVELAKLELLEDAEWADAVDRLESMKSPLSTLSKQLDIDVAKKERSRSRSSQPESHQEQVELQNLLRYRSLSHYYHAWSGYSLAFLKHEHTPADVFVSFGWLLGAEGKQPQYSLLNESTLEFEHVARAGIGLALAYAQSDDILLGRSWLKNIVQSSYPTESVRLAAQSQLLRLMAMDHAWGDLHRKLLGMKKADKAYRLSVKDARYISLQSLAAMQAKNARAGEVLNAKKVAKIAIGDLVKHGEIGHVLELYRRFDSLPLLGNSFITTYARALADLNRAETDGDSALYSSVALEFLHAMKSSDAKLFPSERDDCALKLAYCELRSQRSKEAIAVCDDLIEHAKRDEVIEEARWLRIASLEALVQEESDEEDNLNQAVREYIVAYPTTQKSAKLILRHAMQEAIDPAVADTILSNVADDDPIAVPARRALAGFLYEQSKSLGYTDQGKLERIVNLVRWVTEHETLGNASSESDRMKLGTVRIGLDIALRMDEPDTAFASSLIEYGNKLIELDSSLKVYQSEFVYRSIQVALLDGQLNDAVESLEALKTDDGAKLLSAQRLILNDLMIRWGVRQDTHTARLIIELGSEVVSRIAPPYPERIGSRVSSISEVVVEAGYYEWENRQDQAALDLATHLSKLVIERGKPTRAGLIFITRVASQSNLQSLELEAWLMLLAANESTSEQWYQSRYESLRVMVDLDPSRAKAVYTQFVLLHPDGGQEPWASKIARLAETSSLNDSTSNGGGQP